MLSRKAFCKLSISRLKTWDQSFMSFFSLV
jgi:hypothetical protein